MVASAAEAWAMSRALLARAQSSCINKDGQRRVRKLAKERRKKTERERPSSFGMCDGGGVSVDTLVHTWSPCFVPFWDPREWPPYDRPKYITDLAYC